MNMGLELDSLDGKLHVIAEIACGHEGRVDRVQALTAVAAKAGADAIKFQIYRLDELVGPKHPEYDLFRQWELNDADWIALAANARAAGLAVWVDVFGEASLALAQQMHVFGIKLQSSDLNNVPLLRRAATWSGNILLGTSGSHLMEIHRAVQLLGDARRKGRLVLMPGIQTFPTRLESNNLRILADLRNRFGLPVGCADHLDGSDPFALVLPVLAAADGANIIEKHLTMARAEKWVDFESALEPTEFGALTESLRTQRRLATVPLTYTRTTDEIKYRTYVKKKLVAAIDLPQGWLVGESDLVYTRAATEAKASARYESIRGRRVVGTGCKAGEALTHADVEQKVGLLLIARTGSRRLPRKALRPFAGGYAIEFLMRRMALSCHAANLTLCTTSLPEDDELEQIARANGVPCVRGDVDDVLRRLLTAVDRFGFDHVARLTGDDLLKDPFELDRAIDEHRRLNVDYTRMSGMPNGLEAEVFSAPFLREIAELAEAPGNTEYLSWFVDDADVNSIHTIVYPFDERLRVTLDTAEDYAVLQALERHFGAKLVSVSAADITEFLQSHPEIGAENATVKPKLLRQDCLTRLDFRCPR